MSIINIIKSLSRERVLKEGRRRKPNIHHLTPKHRKWYEMGNVQRKLAEDGDTTEDQENNEVTKKEKKGNKSTQVTINPEITTTIANR